MASNVTSHSQSGGVTAYNVNTQPSDEGRSAWRHLAKVGIILGPIATIIAILTYLGVKP